MNIWNDAIAAVCCCSDRVYTGTKNWWIVSKRLSETRNILLPFICISYSGGLCDIFYQHQSLIQEVLFNYKSELSGTGNRSQTWTQRCQLPSAWVCFFAMLCCKKCLIRRVWSAHVATDGMSRQKARRIIWYHILDTSGPSQHGVRVHIIRELPPNCDFRSFFDFCHHRRC